MYHVDLNSDLGESFGAYTIGLDKEVIAQISSANVACGYHAGDPLVMAETPVSVGRLLSRSALTRAFRISWASAAAIWPAPRRK